MGSSPKTRRCARLAPGTTSASTRRRRRLARPRRIFSGHPLVIRPHSLERVTDCDPGAVSRRQGALPLRCVEVGPYDSDRKTQGNGRLPIRKARESTELDDSCSHPGEPRRQTERRPHAPLVVQTPDRVVGEVSAPPDGEPLERGPVTALRTPAAPWTFVATPRSHGRALPVVRTTGMRFARGSSTRRRGDCLRRRGRQ
jgi:hypothetical protein